MGERFDCEERMMGVYIKGMEMPMYWYECPFCSDGYCFMIPDGDDRICLVNSKEDTHRNENCPLIDLPPHGRLIDADALVDKHFGKEYLSKIMTADEDDLGTALVNIPLVINNAPTIIPASEESRVMELKPYQFCGADMLSHEIKVKGNCTACGKPLGEDDGLFLCAECQKKNKEEE